MDDIGIYDDPGTGTEQPNTEQSRPEGGGVGSRSAEGANKLDPVSAGPNIGNTIAGRPLTGGAIGAVKGAGPERAEASTTREPETEGSAYRGDADTGAKGASGQTGREMGEGTGTSKGAAAEEINPGNSTSNPSPGS